MLLQFRVSYINIINCYYFRRIGQTERGFLCKKNSDSDVEVAESDGEKTYIMSETAESEFVSNGSGKSSTREGADALLCHTNFKKIVGLPNLNLISSSDFTSIILELKDDLSNSCCVQTMLRNCL